MEDCKEEATVKHRAGNSVKIAKFEPKILEAYEYSQNHKRKNTQREALQPQNFNNIVVSSDIEEEGQLNNCFINISIFLS